MQIELLSYSTICNYFKSKEVNNMKNQNYCFLCGEPIYENKKTLFNTYFVDYNLCNTCDNKTKNNIILIAVSESPLYDKQISIKTNRNLYLTGKYAVITKNIIDKTIIPGALKDYMKKHKIIFIHENALIKLLSFNTSLIKENERIKNHVQNIS